jgi:hypothetical protein
MSRFFFFAFQKPPVLIKNSFFKVSILPGNFKGNRTAGILPAFRAADFHSAMALTGIDPAGKMFAAQYAGWKPAILFVIYGADRAIYRSAEHPSGCDCSLPMFRANKLLILARL